MMGTVITEKSQVNTNLIVVYKMVFSNIPSLVHASDISGELEKEKVMRLIHVFLYNYVVCTYIYIEKFWLKDKP